MQNEFIKNLKEGIVKAKTDYLPLSLKREMVDSMVSGCVEIKDGLKIVNQIAKMVSYDLHLIQFYFDVDIESLEMDDIYKDKLMPYIYTLIDEDELATIKLLFDAQIEIEISNYNNFNGIISRSLEKIINLIPDEKAMKKILKDLPKAMEKISPDTISAINNISNNFDKKRTDA